MLIKEIIEVATAAEVAVLMTGKVCGVAIYVYKRLQNDWKKP